MTIAPTPEALTPHATPSLERWIARAMLGLPIEMQTEVHAATGVKHYEPEPISQGHRAWLKRAIPGLSEADQALANGLFGFVSLDEVWFRHLQDVEAYWEEHGELPSKRAVEEFEKSLGIWVFSQRRSKNLTTERRAAIMEHCAAILLHTKDTKTWDQSLLETVKYWRKHGKLPSGVSADKAVRRLGGWVQGQRQGRGLTLERRGVIMEQCPAILTEDSSVLWDRGLAETVQYWRHNGKLPSRASDDEAIKGLGHWVNVQRQNKSLPAERLAAIMEQCPAILADFISTKPWEQWLSEVAEYWHKHGNLPSQHSDDETVKKLGNWIQNQRKNRNPSTGRRAAIMEQCPAILLDAINIKPKPWEQWLSEVVEYFRKHGELPTSTRSQEGHAKSLGAWVGKQRQNKNLSPERRAAIMDQCPVIFEDSNPDVWERNLAETAEHWEKHGKLPSSTSANEAVRRHYRWINTQRQNKNLSPERRAAIMEQCPAILAER